MERAIYTGDTNQDLVKGKEYSVHQDDEGYFWVFDGNGEGVPVGLLEIYFLED